LTDKPPDAPTEDEREPDPELVYLAKRKMNYGSKDLVILRRKSLALAGYFEDQNSSGLMGMAARIDRANVEKVMLRAFVRIEAMGISPTESNSSPHYLPRLILEYGLGEGHSRHEFAQAMRQAMSNGVLARAQIGTYPNRTPKFGLVQMGDPV
jgi:hypothetical protein